MNPFLRCRLLISSQVIEQPGTCPKGLKAYFGQKHIPLNSARVKVYTLLISANDETANERRRRGGGVAACIWGFCPTY